MNMTAEQIIHHLETQDKQIEAIKKFWLSVLPTVELPSVSQMRLWLQQHDLETVCYGISEAGKKNQKLGGTMTLEHAAKFASKCRWSYSSRDPRRKTFRLSDQKPPRNRIAEGGPTFPLAASLADKLGDVPPGLPVTMAMFQRCLHRLADIKSGKV